MSAIVDYLSVTFRPTGDPRAFLQSILGLFLGDALAGSVQDTGHGRFGYAHCLEIPGLGLCMYGGNAGTVHISLTGTGCAAVRDWDLIADTIEDQAAKITRIDLAHDDFEGTHPVQWCRDQYHDGGFNPARGPAPKPRYISDEGTGDGSTFYVGTRAGFQLRAYEKGKQLGDPSSPWVRYEGEWHADNHRELTADMIRHPGEYLAGKYPCLAWINPAEQSAVRTVIAIGKATVEKTLDHARKQAGRALHMALRLTGGDLGAVFEWLHVPELPKRCRALLAAVDLSDTDRPPAFWRHAHPSDRAAFHEALRAPLLA
ncbi:replication initiation factor domain-containing protein [Methyloversatilis sp. NSM2]|uniref:replication initiation factor domain-containing protein n=1 Tax=Methyloversatilis sp. NSM2 TaxID=3134135 RepID=UPI003117C45E